MTGAVNGSALRKPRLATSSERLTAAEQWQEDHERKCEERMKQVNDRLAALEATAGETKGMVAVIRDALIREKIHKDGSTSVGLRLPPITLKGLGVAGGLLVPAILFLQFTFAVAPPAMRAAFEWIMHYGRH